MTPSDKPAASVGEAVKATQNGTAEIGTVEAILKAAPSDLKEKVIEVPEWGCSVRIKSFTAGQQAEIKQRGLAFKGDDTKVAWAEMEIVQFQRGVIEPRFGEKDVRKLHATSGRGFSRVIEAMDELNGIDKEELAAAQQEFPEPKE